MHIFFRTSADFTSYFFHFIISDILLVKFKWTLQRRMEIRFNGIIFRSNYDTFFFFGKSDKFLLTHTPNKIPVAHNVTRAGRGNDTIHSIRKTFQR